MHATDKPLKFRTYLIEPVTMTFQDTLCLAYTDHLKWIRTGLDTFTTAFAERSLTVLHDKRWTLF